MADTLGPQYHLTLIAENVKTCSDIIDVAYLNGLEVELKYTKKNHEVSSVRLLCGKTRDSSPILTTEWVSALKTNIPTAKWRNIRIVGHHWMDKSKAKLIIEYRTKNGKFKDIKEIMNIKGISETLFSKIKENITI